MFTRAIALASAAAASIGAGLGNALESHRRYHEDPELPRGERLRRHRGCGSHPVRRRNAVPYAARPYVTHARANDGGPVCQKRRAYLPNHRIVAEGAEPIMCNDCQRGGPRKRKVRK